MLCIKMSSIKLIYILVIICMQSKYHSVNEEFIDTSPLSGVSWKRDEHYLYINKSTKPVADHSVTDPVTCGLKDAVHTAPSTMPSEASTNAHQSYISQTYRRWIERFQDQAMLLTRGRSERSEAGPFHQPSEKGKDVVVHLFEWRWEDVGKECERFLGPKGFAGVQVSPPNEHSVLMQPFWSAQIQRPWYERYRPVSYHLQTRSGDQEDFEMMLRQCNLAGVRVYVDVVLNHMSFHLDAQASSGGSAFNSRTQDYPAVPYDWRHFNSREKCGSRTGDIEDFQSVLQLRNCRLLGLNDLNQRHQHVARSILSYMNHLIRLGVAGFRVDAAKHMWPRDLEAIFSRLDFLNDTYFPPATKPFIYQEVTDLGQDPISATEYTGLGRVTEFKYGLQLAEIVSPTAEGQRPRLYELKHLTAGPGFLQSHNAFVFVDNHDTQRGHGAGENHKILTFREPQSFVMAVAFMLAWPYGVPCLMSSYWWNQDIESGHDKNDWVGPPHDEQWRINPVEITAQGKCSAGWICEHRWPAIAAMVSFRNVVGTRPVSHWWDNGRDQVAFARLYRGFIAFNGGPENMNVVLQTGLPPGQYCDVLRDSCTEKLVVNNDGEAIVNVPAGLEIPVVAYHVAL